MRVFQTKINEEDADIVSSILQSGELGFGPNVTRFEEKFQLFSKAEHNISVNSASAAAFMIFAYLKEKYGSCDVYTTSLGFTSPAWAAKHFGHNLIWVDVDDNLLFDVNDYREKRRYRCERYTDAGIKPVIMPVLYGGVSTIPNFESIYGDGYQEIVVLDSAHCVTPTLKAHFTFYSFHPFKPVAASDGGMISTNNFYAADWFKTYRNFGRENTNDGYTIKKDGFKFYMNNLNATIALTQLRRYPDSRDYRKSVHELLKNLNFGGRLLPHDNDSSYYFSTLILEDHKVEEMNRLFPTSKHYPMLHKMPYYDYGSALPNLERLHPLILNLPLYDVNIYNR